MTVCVRSMSKWAGGGSSMTYVISLLKFLINIMHYALTLIKMVKKIIIGISKRFSKFFLETSLTKIDWDYYEIIWKQIVQQNLKMLSQLE